MQRQGLTGKVEAGGAEEEAQLCYSGISLRTLSSSLQDPLPSVFSRSEGGPRWMPKQCHRAWRPHRGCRRGCRNMNWTTTSGYWTIRSTWGTPMDMTAACLSPAIMGKHPQHNTCHRSCGRSLTVSRDGHPLERTTRPSWTGTTLLGAVLSVRCGSAKTNTTCTRRHAHTGRDNIPSPTCMCMSCKSLQIAIRRLLHWIQTPRHNNDNVTMTRIAPRVR